MYKASQKQRFSAIFITSTSLEPFGSLAEPVPHENSAKLTFGEISGSTLPIK
jgi:hypothetical protein